MHPPILCNPAQISKANLLFSSHPSVVVQNLSGHDGWVVGDETLEGYEFDAKTAKEYIEIMKNAENKA